jgi:hypothetical protein
MNATYKFSLLSLLATLACQPIVGVANDALALSDAEMKNIINSNTTKIQPRKAIASLQQQVVVTPTYIPPVAIRPVITRPVIARPVITRPVIRRTSMASLPAWRKPASPTMTRSSDDALFGAAKGRNLNLLKQLITEGANVNHQNFNGETVLHIAASLGNIQMVQYLVSQGANINARTGTLWMPIHHAMRFDHPRVANYLISRKARLKQKTIDGLTALDFAKNSKNPQIQAIVRRYGG